MPRLEIAGRTIDYDCPVPLESGQGRVILFVHGASFHRGVWAAQTAHFAVNDRPVCLDLAGHGASSGPICGTVEEHCAIVMAFADALGLADFVLVGHSMGGAIAQALVARRPGDVRALVLVSTTPRFAIPETMVEQWTSALEDYRTQEMDVILAPATGTEVRQSLLAMRDANPPEAQRADLLACARWDGRAAFPAIRQPVLLITARHDSLLAENRRIQRELPHAELVVLDHSSHMMSVEQLAEVNRAIADFLQTAAP